MLTCSECQFQIFDGEMDRDALLHLTGCEECRALDREARLNSEALAAMRGDVIPVRRAVRRWPWVAAVAAAAVLVAGVFYEPTPAEPARVVVVQPEPVAPTPPVPVRAIPAHRARAVKPAAPAEPLLVKFLTDDPDVVIYWLVDPVQGEQAL